jgi:hypothetical protein
MILISGSGNGTFMEVLKHGSKIFKRTILKLTNPNPNP